MTAVAIGVLGVGLMLLYAALTNQSFLAELKAGIGRK